MAFIKDKTGVRQTATNAAVNLVTSFVEAGFIESSDQALLDFTSLRDSIYDDLAAIVDADNAAFAAADTATSGGKRSGGYSKGGASGPITLDEALDSVLNFGAFKTLTFREVMGLSPEEAAEYGYVDKSGKGKPGRQWVQWASKNDDPKAKWARDRALIVVNAARAESDAA